MQGLSVVPDDGLQALAGSGSYVIVDIFWSSELLSDCSKKIYRLGLDL